MHRSFALFLAFVLSSLATTASTAHAWVFERWDYVDQTPTIVDLAACPNGELFALEQVADGTRRVLQRAFTSRSGWTWTIPDAEGSYYGRWSLPGTVSIECGRSAVSTESRVILVQSAAGSRPQQVWGVDIVRAAIGAEYRPPSQRIVLLPDPACGPMIGPHVSLLSLTGARGNEALDVFRFDPYERRVDVDTLRGRTRASLLATDWLWAARDASAARAPDGTMTVVALNDATGVDRWWLARGVTSATGYRTFSPEATRAGSWERFAGSVLSSTAVEVELGVFDSDASTVAHVYVRTNVGQIWHGLARF